MAVATLLAACSASFTSQPPLTQPVPSVAVTQATQFKVHQLTHATIYTLLISPTKHGRLEIGISNTLQTVTDFAEQSGAIAVLNGGFFDPNNGLSTSYVYTHGKLVADPRQNPRLTQNPDLAPWLAKIFNRSAFQMWQCANKPVYSIRLHQEAAPPGCKLQMSLGAGPQLLPQNTAQEEGFTAFQGGTMIRDPIGTQSRNARSAIGIKPDGSLLWVMVAQTTPNSGMTISELIQFLKNQGITTALNLDGGSSSSFFYRGKTYTGKLSSNAEPLLRPVKSVLILAPTQQP
jgi:hypothetical protein